ncbi:MAG: hypothetical protein NWF05_04785 [Candidatus Bathyarchaeota archaeon]|nr:hypothetical protein [Candidatus Bathyarchaeota archaeon]
MLKRTATFFAFLLILSTLAAVVLPANFAYSTVETSSSEPTGSGPVIHSVSPISAVRLQIIRIEGVGFGNTQPVTMSLGDGSINTVGGGRNLPGSAGTPVIQVHDEDRNAWQAGVQDSPGSAWCSIGIFLVSWSDTEIVLGGFGSALSTSGYGQWSIMPGDPMRIVVITSQGTATYNTVVNSDGGAPSTQPTPTPTPTRTPPTISAVSPIAPVRLQTIYINGSGFGDVPPQTIELGNGSVDTIDGLATPVIQIRDNAMWGGWTAGYASASDINGIGIFLQSWSDNLVVLGGFGSRLGTNGEISWCIMSGDPIDILVKTTEGVAFFSTAVTGSPARVNQTFSGPAPVISSVSPIVASQTQTIHIFGSGFGDVPPRIESLGDGSVNTVGGGSTPIIQIHDDGWKGWQAGVRDSPQSGACAIGVVLTKWSDTEIVLGGFGSALSLTEQGLWNIMVGDPMRIVIWTSGGIATYNTTVVSDGEPQPKPTPTPTAPPAPPVPTVDISCQSSTTDSTSKVTIAGNVTYNGTGLQGLPVMLSYSVNGGNSWSDLTLVNTDSNGGFIAVWTPLVTGNFLIKAIWAGNSTYGRTAAQVNLVVTPLGRQSVFSITSNSTVSVFQFDAAAQEITLTVSGETGTTGFIDLCIAKSLVADVSDFKVYLDGNPQTCNYTSQGDSWLLSFSYHHSTHQVTINIDTTEADYAQSQEANWVSIVGVAAAFAAALFALLAVLALLRKRKPAVTA